ncbi:hypothetical protein QO002_000535 [Pararhizobium capsulatum DSM 1112]|uniref:Uncharacterized protein n=1 Tax=Pararhizobium capsulatum DSM 1112 TaxID=1121113 RepID=A0ABU0BNE2_9HYPH|nr:hypothetical protein [Pararhizobium capsulatum]MDQ0318397.1 hypothetical protein [Pararhizobium capsulatum DSM 1112]
MAKHITLDELNSWTFERRQTFYRNNLARFDNAEAVRLVEMMVASGLPFRRGKEIAHGDREMKVLEAIVYSPYNEKLLIDAATTGKPPLGAIEPLIRQELGDDYSVGNGATIAAGYLIARRLYALGYEKGNSQKMPDGSVAKTAATFRKKRA